MNESLQSSVVSYVGSGSKEKKAEVKTRIEEEFAGKSEKGREVKGREKTETELEIIELANKATNEIRKKFGLEPLTNTPDQILIVPEDEWREKKGNAYYRQNEQVVYVRETPSRMELFKKAVHEMLHFKSHNAMTVESEGEEGMYRVGLFLNNQSDESYFGAINEAITEEITRRAILANKDNPLFAEEHGEFQDLKKAYGRKIKDKDGKHLIDDEAYGATVLTYRKQGYLEKLMGLTRKPQQVEVLRFSYEDERKALSELTKKLYERNPNQYNSPDEVFNLFARAAIEGNMLPIGRLIEKTFGKGTFRKIGEANYDSQKLFDIVDSL